MRDMNSKKICTRCIIDSTVPGVEFDQNGECNYCKIHDALVEAYPRGEKGQKILEKTISEVKKDGRNNQYDCIVGVSGGTDSTYLLSYLKEKGLRPLAVHFDNGWDSEIAVNNIKKLIGTMEVDLQTYVVDWEEFKDILISYLKSSIPWADNPTDIGITASLYKVAAEEKVRYIFVGNDFRSEGKQPTEWTYGDGKLVASIQKKFGDKKLKTFPNLTLSSLIINAFIKRIRLVRPFYHIPYNKQDAKKILEEKFDWQDYGGHHYESIYTRFVYSTYLPVKYGIDKRMISLSAQTRSGVIKREDALREFSEPPISVERRKSDIEYIEKKLELSEEDFEYIMNLPPKAFTDYPSYYPTISRFRGVVRILVKFLLPWTPMTFYEMDARKKKIV